jgi:hypothetical protein
VDAVAAFLRDQVNSDAAALTFGGLAGHLDGVFLDVAVLKVRVGAVLTVAEDIDVEPADFELKLDFRITAGNTGVQYRSQRAPDVGQYVLKGYQADIDFANQWTGQLYEERGRGFLALPGQATASTGAQPRVFGAVTPADAVKAAVNVAGWNTIHIIARGDLVVHAVNGKVTAVFLDGDAAKRPAKGAIGLQLHTGPPMRAAACVGVFSQWWSPSWWPPRCWASCSPGSPATWRHRC